MLVHTVLFWLKKDLTEDQRTEFANRINKLKDVKSAEAVYVGMPADTDRPVIDRSYDYCLTVLFKDMSKHDEYQVDSLHKNFLENCKPMFERVLIYDAE